MKRCPRCEFIYNDDQNLCDMDGRDLVYDEALATLPDSGPPGSERKFVRSKVFIAPALAGLLLAAFISLGYFGTPRLFAQPETRRFSEQPKPENPNDAKTVPAVPSPSEAPTQPAETSTDGVDDPGAPASTPQPTASVTTIPEKPGERLTISRRLPPLPRVSPLPRLPPAKVTQKRSTTSETSISPGQRRAQVAGVNQKKESGVRSFLKKTGRILKKPFKR